jgi:uncharacterized protein YfaP (DUF2135 family)
MMYSVDVMRADAKRAITAVIRVVVQGDDTQATIKVDVFTPDRQGDAFVNGVRCMHGGTSTGKVDMTTGKMSGIIPATLSPDVADAILHGLKFISNK